uniref:Putative proline-rich coiled-coil 1 n=1 Tax=Corethrella appendiculata TaxID=1370023 RepID=U5EQY6_9DIPT
MSDAQKTVGNLLSNINPPTELPSFITAAASTTTTTAGDNKNENVDKTITTQQQNDDFIPTKFSAAIPPNKDTAKNQYQTSIDNDATSSDFSNMKINPQPVAAALSPITQNNPPLFSLNWMKGAVSNNTILQKVAEKAKNSVDSIVTTLDPQMKEYINSGGDTEVIVASDKDDKVRPIREAFQTVFGKATVTGLPSQPSALAAQPVGFHAALNGAEQRINNLRIANPRVDDFLPIVAVENFVVELYPDQWFDAGLLLLFDFARNILLKSVTQMTPIPSQVITTINADTPEDYKFKDTGFAVTVGSVMAKNLNTHHTEWHKTYSSVNRSEMILNAAKTLATLYKQATVNSTTEITSPSATNNDNRT